jgi:hypothetical protein
MKFFARLSALGAVAVLSTAFASATVYQFGSYATGAPTLGNQNSAMVFDTVNSQANPGVIYTPATQTVDPGLVWAPNLPHSTWVSFGQTGPTTPAGSMPGGAFPLNGSYFFTSTFTLDAQATAFSFSILADDTTSVYLDGQTGNALVGASSGNNVICNTDTPNCKDVVTVTQADVPLALLLLTAGTHTLTFEVKQIRSIDLGVDFSSTVTTTPSQVPEPSSLLLLGTGLIGSAGALMRKARARA